MEEWQQKYQGTRREWVSNHAEFIAITTVMLAGFLILWRF